MYSFIVDASRTRGLRAEDNRLDGGVYDRINTREGPLPRLSRCGAHLPVALLMAASYMCGVFLGEVLHGSPSASPGREESCSNTTRAPDCE